MEDRDRFALALDVDDLVVATRLARQLKPYFGVAKVGLELYTANGPDAVIAMIELGYHVFLDLKMLDIPNPFFTPDMKYIIFRSNMFGPDYVFAVEVAK